MGRSAEAQLFSNVSCHQDERQRRCDLQAQPLQQTRWSACQKLVAFDSTAPHRAAWRNPAVAAAAACRHELCRRQPRRGVPTCGPLGRQACHRSRLHPYGCGSRASQPARQCSGGPQSRGAARGKGGRTCHRLCGGGAAADGAGAAVAGREPAASSPSPRGLLGEPAGWLCASARLRSTRCTSSASLT